jgi:hypothetical protein
MWKKEKEGKREERALAVSPAIAHLSMKRDTYAVQVQ